jgi:uncharacterized membrane protein YhaH (DUF805 family)
MFDLTRRINRKQFITIFVPSFGIAIIYELILNPVKEGSILGTILGFGLLLYVVFLAVLWIFIAKQRANDISGKYAILVFILFGVSPLFLLFAIIPGEKTANKYGLPPK